MEHSGSGGVLHRRCIRQELNAVVVEELDGRAEERGGHAKDHLACRGALRPRRGGGKADKLRDRELVVLLHHELVILLHRELVVLLPRELVVLRRCESRDLVGLRFSGRRICSSSSAAIR